MGLFFGLADVLFHILGEGLVAALMGWLFLGFCVGLFVGLVFELLVWLGVDLAYGRADPSFQRMHDGIARWQHLRRQRILRRQAFPHVPAAALSRADPSGKPEPTDTSLSLAEPQEEKPRLAGGVEEATAADEEGVTDKETS